MKLAIALLILLATMPVLGRERLSPYPPAYAPEALDDGTETPAKPATLDWRATQVNRCADVNGKVKLQDTPCRPAEVGAASVAAAASTATEVVDLASLEPRPLTRPSHNPVPETETNSFAKRLLGGAWKLGLLLLACYAIFRLIRAWRDFYRYAPATDETTGYGSRRVR